MSDLIDMTHLDGAPPENPRRAVGAAALASTVALAVALVVLVGGATFGWNLLLNDEPEDGPVTSDASRADLEAPPGAADLHVPVAWSETFGDVGFDVVRRPEVADAEGGGPEWVSRYALGAEGESRRLELAQWSTQPETDQGCLDGSEPAFSWAFSGAYLALCGDVGEEHGAVAEFFADVEWTSVPEGVGWLQP